MWRTIGAVVVGYLAIAAFIMVSFSVAYRLMGTEGAFEPNSFEVSMTWIVASFVLGFFAAVAGGFVCALIAKGSKAHVGLAALVFVLGLLMAIPEFMTPKEDPPATRDASVATFDAMSQARQPGWVALTNPLVGLVGVLIGGSLRSSRREPEAGA